MQRRLRFQRLVRRFFEERDYLEWQTPIVVPMPGTEVHMHYFASPWRDVNGKEHPRFLRSSPEIHLKKVLATTGVPRLFELGPCFRSGGELGPWHHPEFMMLEWYRAGADATSFMAETLDLVAFLAQHLEGSIAFDSAQVPTFTMAEAFATFAGLELEDEDPHLATRAREQGVLSVGEQDDFETAFFKVLMEKVEPALKRWPAAFLCDYPPSQAALAKIEAGVARRFELYVNGIEISNGFWELTEAEANRQRIVAANRQRQREGLPITPVDEEFLASLASPQGLPSCCGNALGLDRLLAVLSGESNLDKVVGFRGGYGAAPGEES